MTRLERQILKVCGEILLLPFRLIFFVLRSAFSGTRLNEDGYVLRKMDGKDRLEHRLIAEQVLGRRLESWEVVHHINGKRSDNKLTNLCVMSWKAHEAYHEWYDWIHATYGRYPRRNTQLRKLRETFKGTILSETTGNSATG